MIDRPPFIAFVTEQRSKEVSSLTALTVAVPFTVVAHSDYPFQAC
jgi:hypothetical protein